MHSSQGLPSGHPTGPHMIQPRARASPRYIPALGVRGVTPQRPTAASFLPSFPPPLPPQCECASHPVNKGTLNGPHQTPREPLRSPHAASTSALALSVKLLSGLREEGKRDGISLKLKERLPPKGTYRTRRRRLQYFRYRAFRYIGPSYIGSPL